MVIDGVSSDVARIDMLILVIVSSLPRTGVVLSIRAPPGVFNVIGFALSGLGRCKGLHESSQIKNVRARIDR